MYGFALGSGFYSPPVPGRPPKQGGGGLYSRGDLRRTCTGSHSVPASIPLPFQAVLQNKGEGVYIPEAI